MTSLPTRERLRRYATLFAVIRPLPFGSARHQFTASVTILVSRILTLVIGGLVVGVISAFVAILALQCDAYLNWATHTALTIAGATNLSAENTGGGVTFSIALVLTLFLCGTCVRMCYYARLMLPTNLRQYLAWKWSDGISDALNSFRATTTVLSILNLYLVVVMGLLLYLYLQHILAQAIGSIFRTNTARGSHVIEDNATL